MTTISQGSVSSLVLAHLAGAPNRTAMGSAVRAAVRAAGFETPVVGAGGIQSFELAESALACGDCDFVASARQSLA